MGVYSFIIISIIFLVFLNIVQIKNNSIISIRIVCFLLFIVTGLRYVSLFIFTLDIQTSILKYFVYFYYGSMIGITIPSILALWYTIPRFRKR